MWEKNSFKARTMTFFGIDNTHTHSTNHEEQKSNRVSIGAKELSFCKHLVLCIDKTNMRRMKWLNKGDCQREGPRGGHRRNQKNRLQSALNLTNENIATEIISAIYKKLRSNN